MIPSTIPSCFKETTRFLTLSVPESSPATNYSSPIREQDVQASQFNRERVLRHFKEKTKKSAVLLRRAKGITPGGVSAGIKFFEPYPVFMERAKGAFLWDV